MLVYVIRHGQSEGNFLQAHSGQNGVPLTEKGRADARSAGRRLAGIAFDRVYASDTPRAVETAAIALPDSHPEYDSRLREIDVGELTGHLISECVETYGEEYVRNKSARDFTPYGGENHEMQYARVAAFMEMLEEEPDCENVAVFTHGGAIRCMMQYVFDLPKEKIRLLTENGSVTVFAYKNGEWFLCLK